MLFQSNKLTAGFILALTISTGGHPVHAAPSPVKLQAGRPVGTGALIKGIPTSAYIVHSLCLQANMNVLAGDEEVAKDIDQQVREKIEEAVRKRIEKKNAKQEKNKRKLIRHLAVRIDHLKRICGITDAQAKRLTIAAKGTVDEYLTEGKSQIKQIDDPTGFEMRQFAGVTHVGGGHQLTFVANHPIWKNAIEKVLSKEQLSMYAEDQQQRQTFRREAVINTIVKRFDRVVLLTQSQRGQLQKQLTEKFGERIDKIKDNGQIKSYVIATIVTSENEPLEAVLDDSQLETWKKQGMNEGRDEQFLPAGGFF